MRVRVSAVAVLCMAWALSTPLLADNGSFDARAQSTGVVSGTLIGPEGPLASAVVYLRGYRGERCKELAERPTLSEQEQMALESCSFDTDPVMADAAGKYELKDVVPGYYKLIFQWTFVGEAPSPLPLWLDRRGGFLISYRAAGTPKTYTALAQGEIFEFSGEDKTVDFNYEG